MPEIIILHSNRVKKDQKGRINMTNISIQGYLIPKYYQS